MKTQIRIWMWTILLVIVTVQRPDAQSDSTDGTVEVMNIVKSGFLSSDKIVIKYRLNDLKIISITKNGMSVPESEYPDYVSYFCSGREIDQLRQIVPRINDLQLRLDSPNIADSVKLAELAELLKILRSMESDMAETYASVLETRQWRLIRPYLMRDIFAAMDRHKIASDQGLELTIGSETCLVDGEPLPDDLGREIRDIFQGYTQIVLGENDKVVYVFDKNKNLTAIRRSHSAEE